MNVKSDNAAPATFRQVQGYWGDIPFWYIRADGTTSFATTYSNNIFLKLEPDDPNNYVSTTNAEGETEQVYSGPSLNVREVLLDLQSKVETLQAEIQTLKGGTK